MIYISVHAKNSPLSISAVPLNITTFKGGEVNVKLTEQVIYAINKDTEVNVGLVASLTNSDELMALMLVVDAIRRINSKAIITALIPYFPYARQDRVCNPGEALSVSVVANMINSLQLDKVIVVDPHSTVTEALIKNLTVIDQSHYMHGVKAKIAKSVPIDKVWLMAPDQGAYKKVLNLASHKSSSGAFAGFMHAVKERDPKTMEIKQVQIHGEVKDKHILVVDDICDGGRTFLQLGALLREQKAASIRLFVTHGIFSYGTKELCEMYDEVITTHSFHDPMSQATNNELSRSNLYWLYV